MEEYLNTYTKNVIEIMEENDNRDRKRSSSQLGIKNYVTSETKNNDELNLKPLLAWFWNFATKWYFFPLLYLVPVLLTVILPLIMSKSIILDKEMSLILLKLVNEQVGLLSLLELVGIDPYKFGIDFLGTENIGNILSILFFVFAIASIISIQYYKNKKGKILKWLIITLLLVMLLYIWNFLYFLLRYPPLRF